MIILSENIYKKLIACTAEIHQFARRKYDEYVYYLKKPNYMHNNLFALDQPLQNLRKIANSVNTCNWLVYS